MYRLFLCQNALKNTFALLSVKRLKHPNNAVTINLNTLIEQSKISNKLDNQLIIVPFNEVRIACEDNGL